MAVLHHLTVQSIVHSTVDRADVEPALQTWGAAV